MSSTSADVAAKINPNGKAATYIVEYGPTTSYGLQTTAAAIGAGLNAVSVHPTLGNLKSGTVYQYRIVAINADGTTTSADGTFETTGNRVVTSGPLPTVSEAAAVELIALQRVQLNGAVNPRAPSSLLDLRGRLTDRLRPADTGRRAYSGFGPHAINPKLSGLESDATYHYRLVAYSANGLYVGPDHTFTTRPSTRVNARGIIVDASTYTVAGSLAIRIHGRLRLPSATCNFGGLQRRRRADRLTRRRDDRAAARAAALELHLRGRAPRSSLRPPTRQLTTHGGRVLLGERRANADAIASNGVGEKLTQRFATSKGSQTTRLRSWSRNRVVPDTLSDDHRRV